MIKYGLILMSVCLVASLVLSFTYRITEPLILAQKQKRLEEALRKVLPECDSFLKQRSKNFIYFVGYKNNEENGYAVKVTAKGYSGEIEMLAGVDREGKIKGLLILEHSETPGLGAKIEEVKYGEKEPWFLRQFRGKSAKELNLSKIQAITGATISSGAVVDSVRESVEDFIKEIER